MSDFDDIKEFDEKECVRFIRAGLESEISTKYCDNELLDVVVAVFDYYDARGLFDISDICDEEDEIDPAVVADSVTRRLAKRHSKIDPADIPAIVNLELAYEETLSTF